MGIKLSQQKNLHLFHTGASIPRTVLITFGHEVNPEHLAVLGEHLADVRRVHVRRDAAEVAHPALPRQLPLAPCSYPFLFLATKALVVQLLVQELIFLLIRELVVPLGGLRHGVGRFQSVRALVAAEEAAAALVGGPKPPGQRVAEGRGGDGGVGGGGGFGRAR